MKDFLTRIKSQLTELWQKTTRVQKAIVIGSGVLIILALTFFIRQSTQPDFRPLFTKLDDASASAVVQKLKDAKIPYQLQDSGTTILVPAQDVDEQRINMVSDGTASDGTVTFSIFDKTQFGETDTDKRVKFLRAVQGELTRTIEKFPAVDTARVHIVTPEPSLFEDNQKDATAAIWLKLKTGKKMSDNEVNGLVRLVSSSVEGLKPQNVTVVDTNGNVISNKINQNAADAETQNLSENQIQLQQKTQDIIKDNVQSMLDRVMGPGQSVVRVTAELDLDQVKKEKVTLDGTKVPVSEQKDEKTSTNTTNPGGVPGTDSNVNGGTTTYQSTDTGGTSSSEESHRITNNEIGKETEQRVQNPGQIKRLSVAVVFNGDVDQKKQKDIENVVSQAAGIDSKRGDSISVVAMPFNTKYADEVNAAMAKDEQRQQLLTYGGIALGILAVGLIGFVVFRKRKNVSGVVSEEEVFPVDMEPVNDFLENIPELSAEEKEKARIKEQVERVATNNPADVAQLLKTWLAEE